MAHQGHASNDIGGPPHSCTPGAFSYAAPIRQSWSSVSANSSYISFSRSMSLTMPRTAKRSSSTPSGKLGPNQPSSSSKYRIQFIGSGGRLLRESVETQATYVFTGDEGYVRAKILESNGLVAWCQPVRPPSR
jgi:hypothetical protein